MKEIPLTRGMVALVDDKDFKKISKYSWCAVPSASGFYAKRTVYSPIKKNISMHRVVLGLPKNKSFVDHINGNTLDNQRENLRIVNHAQNKMNQAKYRGASKFKGVYRSNKRWASSICFQGRQYRLGLFDTELEAAIAYDKKSKQLFKEFARPNHICPTCKRLIEVKKK